MTRRTCGSSQLVAYVRQLHPSIGVGSLPHLQWHQTNSDWKFPVTCYGFSQRISPLFKVAKFPEKSASSGCRIPCSGTYPCKDLDFLNTVFPPSGALFPLVYTLKKGCYLFLSCSLVSAIWVLNTRSITSQMPMLIKQL